MAEKHRCRYTNSRGERCAHRLIESSTGLCTIHQRQREEETQTRSQEHYEMLFEDAGLLQTREEVRPFLATLLRLIALNQIPKDKAALLAYTCSLTLQTLPLRSRTEDDDFSFFRDVLPKFAPAAPPTGAPGPSGPSKSEEEEQAQQ